MLTKLGNVPFPFARENAPFLKFHNTTRCHEDPLPVARVPSLTKRRKQLCLLLKCSLKTSLSKHAKIRGMAAKR